MTERRDRDERVSLHGLDPEEALRALMASGPHTEPADQDGGEHRHEGGQDDHDERDHQHG